MSNLKKWKKPFNGKSFIFPSLIDKFVEKLIEEQKDRKDK